MEVLTGNLDAFQTPPVSITLLAGFAEYRWPYVLVTYLLSNLVAGTILRTPPHVRVDAKPQRLISPAYFNLFLLLAIVLHFVFPIQTFVRYPFTLSGILPILFGLVINLQARRNLEEKRTTDNFFGKPTVLITNGVFRYSRNPMYLGGILVSFGLATLLGSLISFLFPIVLFLLLNALYIPQEEDRLWITFGKTYLDYKNRVRRWI